MKNNGLNIWSFIEFNLLNGSPCYLMVIVGSQGSSPGRKGFKMVVSKEGSMLGSIGGGAMEHRLVEHCKAKLEDGDLSVFVRKEAHHGNSESPSGMICSGNQSIAFFPMLKEQLPLVQKMLSMFRLKESIVLGYSNKGIELLKQVPQVVPFKKNQYSPAEDWYYSEAVGKQPEVYIVGGGHVSWALSQQLSILDFRITVFDDREQVNTFVENHFAHEKKKVDYVEVGKCIPEGRHVMVVIMTQLHASDALVLSQLASKNLGYLGMMGSQAKVKTIFGQLEDSGIANELLKRVHAPIGIKIKSQSPEEIAVSIAAELIEVKNRGAL